MSQSEWQLSFLGSRKKVIKLEKFLDNMMRDDNRSVEERNLASAIIASKQMVAEHKKNRERGICYHQSAMHLGEVWTEMVDELLDYARNKLKIKAAYARLGEEMDDYEFDDMEGLRLGFTRCLNEVEL